MPSASLLGAWGESQAAEYLRRRGYHLVAAGYRSRYGEIDLIAQNRRYLVFVEVKTRSSAAVARAMEYVDGRKQQRLRMTAAAYLAEHPTRLQPRFDVIEVYAPEGIHTPRPEINHMEDAFE